MSIRNEEKAEELAQYYSQESDYKRTVGYDCAIAMAEWKDEQYAKVLAKLIVELDELKHQVKSLLP